MIESSAGAGSSASHASVVVIYGLAGVALLAACLAMVIVFMARMPRSLQAGAYVVAVKPSQFADFFTIASASCPLFPTVDFRATATAKQTVLAGAALPATFPSSGLTYDNSNHPAVNFFVSA